MNSSVSILVTYYNEGPLIYRCLDSIAQQSLMPHKVLIYDDYSEAPLKSFLDISRYNFPIELYRTDKNQGPAYGRNYLVEKADSKYLRFQDADDELFENAMLEIEQTIQTHEPDFILNEVSSYTPDNQLIQERVIGLSRDIKIMFNFSLYHAILTPAVTYKKSIIQKIKGFKTRDILPQSEDADFSRRAFLTSNNFHFIDKPLAKQNIRINSHSKDNFSDIWPSNLRSLLELKDQIKEENKISFATALLLTGDKLYYAKNYPEAKKAYNEFKLTHVKKYEGYNFFKRTLARFFGLYIANEISRVYRNLLPNKFRKLLKR